jgi:predicted RNase H-like HicB family nuclease
MALNQIGATEMSTPTAVVVDVDRAVSGPSSASVTNATQIYRSTAHLAPFSADHVYRATRRYARLRSLGCGLNVVQRTFTVRLRKDEETGYYAARCVELPEAISQGKTEEEAITNLREALELVLEEYESQAKKEGDKLIPIIV